MSQTSKPAKAVIKIKTPDTSDKSVARIKALAKQKFGIEEFEVRFGEDTTTIGFKIDDRASVKLILHR